MEIIFKELKKPWLGKYAGITLIPYVFIYLKNKTPKQIEILKNHELIHAAQVNDEIEKRGAILGWIMWYWSYIACWLKGILGGYFSKKGMSSRQAYMAIPAEKEAYENEMNLDYLKTRKPFAVKDYE